LRCPSVSIRHDFATPATHIKERCFVLLLKVRTAKNMAVDPRMRIIDSAVPPPEEQHAERFMNQAVTPLS